MKKLIGFLSDPSLHIMLIALGLLGVASLFGGKNSGISLVDASHCDFCEGSHDPSYQCIRVISAGDAPQLGAVR